MRDSCLIVNFPTLFVLSFFPYFSLCISVCINVYFHTRLYRVDLKPLNRLFNVNYHFNYTGVFNTLSTDPHVRTAYKKLHEMAKPNTNELICNSAENSRTAEETINFHFVRKALEGKNVRGSNLVEILKKVMTESGFPTEKVEAAVGSFDPNLSVETYYKQYSNIHIVRSRAFSSYAALSAFANGPTKAVARGHRRYEMKITAPVILSLINSNQTLLSDGPRDQFLDLLRTYVKKTDPHGHCDGQTGNDVLKNIQINCLLNADIRLSSENQKSECSLAELSKFTDQAVPIRQLTSKDVNNIMKNVHNLKPDYDLVKNEGQLTLTFNCFHCRSATRTQDENNPDKDNSNSKLKITKQNQSQSVLAHFNVNKAQPLDNMTDIQEHMNNYHSIGDARMLSKRGSHSFLLACPLCVRKGQTDHVFSCCVSHLDDHNK